MFGRRPDLVAAAYNAGEGAVQSYGGVPPYEETQKHVALVAARTQKYAAPDSEASLPQVPAPATPVSPR